jgi:uncharacterized protein YhfF
MDAPQRRAEVQEYWEVFRATNGTQEQHYDVYAFGDSPEMADELLDLVLHGSKRATASLMLEFEHDEEPVPQQGTYSVILDGRGKPAAVLRTTADAAKAAPPGGCGCGMLRQRHPERVILPTGQM